MTDGGVVVLAVKRRVPLVSKRTVYVPIGFVTPHLFKRFLTFLFMITFGKVVLSSQRVTFSVAVFVSFCF